jgi:hypothetical protein
MKVRITALLAVAAFCAMLSSCAQTGVPLPPSLELPKPPSDLRALRKGNQVLLAWSEPRLTTDRETVRSLGPTDICRSTEADIRACGTPAASVPAPATQPKPKGKGKEQPKSVPQAFTDVVPSELVSDSPVADLTYAVEVLNHNGRGAGLSNLTHVPAIKVAPAPTDLAAQLNEDGVLLTWTSAGELSASPGAQFRYRIYRREEGGGKDAIAGEVPAGSAGPAHFLDAIEWEKTYLYRVTPVSNVTRDQGELQVEGDDSATVRVVAHDVFPPAVPTGLQAVFSGEGQKPFIDLIWAPVASADLAGYNVYRREEGASSSAAAVKVNADLVKTPSYRDSAVSVGKTYVYSVSAVDVRGNESARSEEASETAPASN